MADHLLCVHVAASSLLLIAVGEVRGDILVNGHAKEQHTWSRVVGYCEQNDIHTPLQTVKEALLFSARLRLPATVSHDKVRIRESDMVYYVCV